VTTPTKVIFKPGEITTHFLNLTNGLYATKYVGGNYHLLRIESTACEQKLWDRVVMSATPDLLTRWSQGATTIIWDRSERPRSPRALWQGVPFISYCFDRQMGSPPPTTFVLHPRGGSGGLNVAGYFEECYRGLEPSTRKYLRYFRKFLGSESGGYTFICRWEKSE
jgi:hypothetical protein